MPATTADAAAPASPSAPPPPPPSASASASASSPAPARPSPMEAAPLHDLVARYRRVRGLSESLCGPLETEDYVIQTMEDVSPAKWHLGHTTWFYERFILEEYVEDYQAVSPSYYYLFNSYYNAAGPMHCRPSRGLLSRPTVCEVYAYRHEIDRRMSALLAEPGKQVPRASVDDLRQRLVLGLNHEQQHQELMVTDLKHIFSSNPLLPAYHHLDNNPPTPRELVPGVPSASWVAFKEGLRDVGHDPSENTFAYDNETPRHRVYLRPFAIASRPVTNAEYVQFIEDDGYERHELWLSPGWATVKAQGWSHPIYWFRDGHDPARPEAGVGDDRWMHYTLGGPVPVDPDEPVCHLSYFEADAFARWAGARLPTEFEWEAAAVESGVAVEGNFVQSGRLHPQPLSEPGTEPGRVGPASSMQKPGSTRAGSHANPASPSLQNMFGDVWEWTASQYTPYPGFRPLPGALGEYNGKFMCNQFVLRGGSCATSRDHTRATYRNFFPPHARWQYTGLRLAKDL